MSEKIKKDADLIFLFDPGWNNYTGIFYQAGKENIFREYYS